ncbi:MAG: DUF481 domain-containing protein [Candidatus Aminicenantes bacterium]|nr:MAG: DUF481 domain-containing protein [Candidatus Aminicenantes bacterium]
MRPIRRLKRLLTTLLVLAGTIIFAGTSPEESRGQSKNWTLAVKGGITLNAGNTKSQLINGGLKFQLDTKPLEFTTSFDTFYGTSGEEQIVNKGQWYNKISGKTWKRFNLYGVISLEYDKFSKIALRGNGGLGIKTIFADSKKTKTHLAASINGEFTDALEGVENQNSFRLNLNGSLKKNLSTTTTYTIDILYTSNWGNFFEDFRVEVNVSLSVVMKKPLGLKIEMQDRYTNRPLQENLKKNDFILVASLEVSI